MRQILRKHGLTHRLVSSDPGEMGLAPASVMGTVIGSAALSSGLVLYKGTLYLPDRDGPELEAGEEIVISYSHFEPVNHFSWMAARAHIVSGLDASEYDFRHPWESDPWGGGIGAPFTGSRTWNQFTAFAAVTNDDGEVATWTFPSSVTHAEQYAFDDTGVGHIGYLLHDFSVANETGSVSVAYSGASTERAGSINFNSGAPVTVGDMVGESQVSATSSEIGITLTEDIPAGSQLLIVTAAKGPPGFSPTDAGTRPQILLRLPTGSLIPKFLRGHQQHALPEFPSVGTTIPASLPPSGAAGGALDGAYPNPGLASSVAGAGLAETSDVLSVNVDATSIVISADTLSVGTIDGGSP